MKQFIATLNVVAWAGFWAFGYLALTADPIESRQIALAAGLAAAGAGCGLWCWFRLVRFSEASGYAPAPKRAYPMNNYPGEDA